MFLVLTTGLLSTKFTRRVVPPLLPTIIVSLDITSVEAGIALTVATMFFALAQFPGGRLADQLTRKTAILAGLTTLLVGAAVLAGSSSYLFFLCGVAIVGIGEGLYGPSDRALLSDLFVKRRGQAFGFHTIASDAAGVLAGVVVAILVIGTWQHIFLPVVVFTGILLVLVYRYGDEPVIVSPVPLGVQETVVRLFGIPRFRRLIVVYSLFAFTQQGILGFLPTLLQVDLSFSPEVASGMFASVFAVGALSKPIAGGLSDRTNRLYVGGGGLLVSSGGIGILLTASTPFQAMMGITVFAAGQMSFPPVLQAYLMDLFPDTSMGGDLGATRAIYMVIGSLGPTYVGFVAERASYSVAFIGLIVCLLAAGVFLLWTSNIIE